MLSKITSTSYGLAVTGATAEEALALKDDTRVRSVAVLDTAAGISAKLDDLAELGGRLKELRSSGANSFEVTADQLQNDALVIGKLYRGYELSVRGATMAQAAPLISNRKVVAVDVADTAANIAANLSVLSKLGSDLGAIHLTDEQAQPLVMDPDALRTYGSLLSKIDGDYSVSITGASVFEAQTLSSDSRVSSIAVADTGSAIASALDALAGNDLVTSITQTGRPRSLSITAAQLDSGALGKMEGNYTLAVSGVKADEALSTVQGNSRIASISVRDSGQTVVSSLADLAILGKRVSSITLDDASTPLALSVANWASSIGTLAKIDGGYSVALSGVSAAYAKTLANDDRVRSMAVSDSAAEISAQLDSLHELGATLTSITQTDAGTAVNVSGRQYATQARTLAKLGDDYTLSVRDAAASQATAIAADSKVVRVAITDSSRNIAARLDDLQSAVSTDNTKVWSIRQAGSPGTMSITGAQYAANQTALGAITGEYQLRVVGVSVANAATVAADSHVVSLSAVGDAAALKDQLSSLAGLGSRLTALVQSDAATTAMDLTAAQWSTFKPTLDKVVGGSRVALTAVSASQVQSLSADWRVQSVAVSDTGAQIAANLSKLQTAGPLVSSIEQTDGSAIAITMSQLRANAAALGKLDNGSTLAVRGATVADAQTLLGDDYAKVGTISVTDTGANVSAAFAALKDNGKLQAINISNMNAPLAVTQAGMDTYAGVLGKVQGNYRLAVREAAAGDVATLLSNSRVASVAVSGSWADDIQPKLADLRNAGRKLSRIDITGSTTLALSYSEWASNQGVLAKIGQRYGAAVSGVSAANADVVAAATQVTSVSVSDTTARIARNLNALQAIGPALTSITATDSGTPPAMTLTAAQVAANATALGKISDGNYRLAVTAATVSDAAALAGNAKVASIAVADTSEAIAVHLSELAANTALSSISQTGTPTTMALTASQYSLYTNTLAKIQGSWHASVSGAAVATAADLQADTKVTGFTVKDSTSAVAGGLSQLNAMGKLGGIELTQDDGLISVTQTQLDTLSDVIDLLKTSGGASYRLRVTDVSVDQAATVAARDDVDSIAVGATSAEASESFNDLAALGDKVASVTLSTPNTAVALTHAQWLSQSSLLAKFEGTPSLAILDVRAANATAVSQGTNVTSVGVRDTAEAISGAFDSLVALGSTLRDVEVSDAGDIVITADQETAGSDLIDKIVGEHEVVVQG